MAIRDPERLIVHGEFLVCYVTDRHGLEVPPEAKACEVLRRRIESAAAAGADWVQIREKDLGTPELLALSRAAVEVCAKNAQKSRILINDRLDIAIAAGAGGVHAGEKSLPLPALVNARRSIALEGFLVGVSCHSVESVVAAARDGAEYVFFGPVFATPSKAAFGAPQGLAKLTQACRAVAIPVIAIGGVTVTNAGECRRAGAAGVAAIRLFQQDRELPEIVRQLHRC